MNPDNKTIVNYQTPPQLPFWRRPLPKGVPFAVLFTVFVLLPLFAIISTPGSHRESNNRRRCATHLRAIGQAIELYIADNNQLPDSFESLVTTRNFSPDLFVCPSSKDTPVDKNHLSDLTSKPGHNSYLYFAANQSPDWLKNPPATEKDYCCSSNSDRIIACENFKNHDGEGAHFLFADGHVDWYSKQQARTMISELQAGFNPPRNPQVAPVTSPAVR